MNDLVIQVERTAAFAREADALGPLVALGEALASTRRAGGLWTPFRGSHLELDATTFGLLLAEARWIRADLAHQPTHVLPICTAPAGPGEVGTISVSVRAGASSGSFPGLVLVSSLPGEAFDTRAEALGDLLERVIEAVDADAAMIGPRAWARREGAAWSTFTRRRRPARLPAGSTVSPIRSGVLVVAHTEDPASESAVAREAALRVRDGLLADARAEDAENTAAGPGEPFEAPERLSPPRIERLPAELTDTAPTLDLPRGPDLPFARSASAAPPVPPSPAVPVEMNIEQYALLRAHLTVRGEDDQETWRRFGVASLAIKHELQGRFAARFRQDPAAQALFLELVPRLIAQIRRGGAQSKTNLFHAFAGPSRPARQEAT